MNLSSTKPKVIDPSSVYRTSERRLVVTLSDVH